MSKDDLLKAKEAEFAEYLANNPYSRVGQIDIPQPGIVIFSPWGDDSIILYLDEPSTALSRALNAVLLPERFTAIYHKVDRRMEFIYTAFAPRSELRDRHFEFTHKGKAHDCSFAPCSPELLVIAQRFRPARRFTGTDHRNLNIIQAYVLKQSGVAMFEDVPLTHPTSFWVNDVGWDEAEMMNLAHHLNFYTAYYDTKAPQIVTHAPRTESIAVQPQTQFRLGKFPRRVTSKQIDEELFHFWTAARTGDTARRFVYNYQIIEYGAHYIVADGIKARLRRQLLMPHALDDPNDFIDDVIDITSESKMQDHSRIEAVLRRCVNPKVIWREIHRNLGFFDKPTIFEGGFEVPSIASKDWGAGDFEKTWPGTFAGTIRNIRNGLSHAKEHRMANVIAPTRDNHEKLQNWVTLAALTAAEVMIYRSEA